jgi:hypothetical protein
VTHENLKMMRAIFDWSEGLVNEGKEVTRAQIERFFAPNAKMITNGELKCAGHDKLLKHFEELKQRFRDIKIGDLSHTLAQEGHTAATYEIDFHLIDGRAGTVHTGVFWEFDQGRVREILEYVFFKDVEVVMLNHQ